METHRFQQYVFIIAVIILTIVLLFLLIASARVASCNDFPDVIEELDPYSLKSGDILGVGYKHPFGCFVTGWSGSIWSHTGIIWVDPKNGGIYVLEAALYGGVYKGVFKIPLGRWMKINKGQNLGLTRIRGKAVDPEVLINSFNERRKHVELDSYSWRWWRLLFKTPYYEETRTKYTCYEIVVTVLQDAGVIKKLYTCSSYFPTDIMEGRIELTPGYIMEPPIALDVRNYIRESGAQTKNKRPRCVGSMTSFLSQ